MTIETSMVKQVEYIVTARRIRILAVAIMAGLLAVFFVGLFVAENNVNKDLAILNLISVIVCSAVCIASIPVKKMFLKKLNDNNFKDVFFQAHIIAYAMCDFGGLFCITTNLFINANIIYASFGILVALIFMFLNLPKSNN